MKRAKSNNDSSVDLRDQRGAADFLTQNPSISDPNKQVRYTRRRFVGGAYYDNYSHHDNLAPLTCIRRTQQDILVWSYSRNEPDVPRRFPCDSSFLSWNSHAIIVIRPSYPTGSAPTLFQPCLVPSRKGISLQGHSSAF